MYQSDLRENERAHLPLRMLVRQWMRQYQEAVA